MKILNLAILTQLFENHKNFCYNNIMKSKKDINKFANEIADLELKIQSANSHKDTEKYMYRIEEIIEGLSLGECIELNEVVIEKLKNS